MQRLFSAFPNAQLRAVMTAQGLLVSVNIPGLHNYASLGRPYKMAVREIILLAKADWETASGRQS